MGCPAVLANHKIIVADPDYLLLNYGVPYDEVRRFFSTNSNDAINDLPIRGCWSCDMEPLFSQQYEL